MIKPIDQLTSLDAKEFEMGNYKVVIAQVNAVDTNDVLSRQKEIEESLRSKFLTDNLIYSYLLLQTY